MSHVDTAAAPAATSNSVSTLAEPGGTERIALGQRAYRRSCVHCHGITPKALPHRDAERFLQVVMDGRNEMPALGFKLTAQEVATMRAYVAQCAANSLTC